MNKSWPSASLDAVLRRVKDGILIRDNETYARLTIRLNGKGIVQRDRVSGGEIGTKRQFVARTGQLVLSKIDARNGAFGVLPQDCDNAIITGNFWAFDPNPEMVMPEYLAFLTTTPLFVEFCVRASEGTTNRRYLQEDEFLAQEILLPPLAEQKRLVGILSQISDKILDVRKTRSIQILRLQEMLTGTFWRIAAEAPRLPLRKVAQ
jgi:type I restriction enzyme S subunit